MLGLEEAQERLLALAPDPKTISIPIAPVPARYYLARDHYAERSQPSADLSAMDGYAISDGSGPWELVGESRAGTPYSGALEKGQCTRISTGAHMPLGADRVLIQENAKVEGQLVHATDIPNAGRHVRKAGFDFREGSLVLEQGASVSPAVFALAASAGLTRLDVGSPPKVAVLDSGDELVPVGQPLSSHQIPASNGIMLAAMLYPFIGEVSRLGPVADSPQALAEALERAETCDILITSGGASVGDHDLVRPALEKWGATIDFWKVAIKPGKPLMVATRNGANGKQVILGLPGNPVSSFVTAFLFALPLVRKAMGDLSPLPQTLQMKASEPLPATGSRREFLRAVSDGERVRLAASQDSSALYALAHANCLIDRPAGSPEVAVGDVLPVFNLENG